MVARVVKPIGFCQFTAKVERPDGAVVDATVLIRGKFKGGRHCPARVEAGCFVLVEGDPKRLLEIVGVINRKSELDKLRRAGRISKALAGDELELDDIFDRTPSDEEDAAAAAADAAAAEKELNATEELVSRYRRRAQLGVRQKEGLLNVSGTEADTANYTYSDAEDDENQTPSSKPRRRVKISVATLPLQQAKPKPTEEEDTIFVVQDKYSSLPQRHHVPKSWEDDGDDVDIDAI